MRTQTTLTPVSAITDIQICARPNAARMITRALIERAKMMLPLTVLITLLAILIAFGSCLSVPDARTASDASIAASLPNPIAIPQSLAERTGASLMPSPTKQAPLDFDFKLLSREKLCVTFGKSEFVFNIFGRLLSVACEHYRVLDTERFKL